MKLSANHNGIFNTETEEAFIKLAECYAKLGCNAIQARDAIKHFTEALNNMHRPETEVSPVPQNEIDSSNFLNQIIPDPEILEIEDNYQTLTEIARYIENGGYKLYE